MDESAMQGTVGEQVNEVRTPPAMWSVRAHGEVDIRRSALLSSELDTIIDQGARLVMLDLEGVTFLDSSGLRVIARAGERLRERDGQLLIEGASGAVARVLEITGLLEHYAVESNRAD